MEPSVRDRGLLRALPALARVSVMTAFQYRSNFFMAVLFGAEKAFAYGVGPFILTDLVKIGIAACLVPAVAALFARKA